MPALLLISTLLTGCAATGSGPSAEPDGAVTMERNLFGVETRQIPVGGQVTFSNAGSRTVHVLVVGKDGAQRSTPGAPSFGVGFRHRTGIGDRWTTPPWSTPGTFHITCTLHPSMNMSVVVR